ncbi:MAG: hypothetical protein KJ902_01540, partial [Candidatus Omnitrophica bacterium]|nr:hypothetical protein [Candidatus Omnitrophota bacterium]
MTDSSVIQWTASGSEPYGIIRADDYLVFQSNGGDEVMRLLASGNVGIGTTGPDGTLHVHTATAGAVTANAEANDLVIEGSAAAGLSILTPDNIYSQIYFGSPSDNLGAQIAYNYDADIMLVSTHNAGAELTFNTGNGTEQVRIDSSGNVGIGTTGPLGRLQVSGTGNVVFNTTGKVGIGTTGPGSLLDVLGANVVTSNTTKGILNVASNNAEGIDVGGSITLGGYRDSGASQFRVFGSIEGRKSNATDQDSSGYLAFKTDNAGALTEWMRILNTGNVGIGTTGPGQLLNVYSATDAGARLRVSQSTVNAEFGVSYAAPSYGVGLWSSSVQQAHFIGQGLSLGTYVNVNPPAGGLITSGNVGIGTTGPGAKLEVGSSVNEDKYIKVTNIGNDRAALGITSNEGVLELYASTGQKGVFLSGYSGWDSYILGNVGIGTTSPQADLHVQGDLLVTGSVNFSSDGKLVLTPEYETAALSPSGSSNNGILTAKNTRDAASGPKWYNYYNWVSNTASLQTYDIMAGCTAPEEFDGFTASNAITVDYYVDTNASVDVTVRKGALATTAKSGITTGSWLQGASGVSFSSADLSGLSVAAGETFTIQITVKSSTTSANCRVGNVTLNYNR